MVSLKSILKKNTSYLAFAETVSMLILFVISIIIARSLGHTVYGQFAFILAYAQIWQVLADFGLTMIAVRELSTHQAEQKRYLSNLISLKLVIGCLTFCLIVISTWFLEKPDFIKQLIYIAGAYIIIYTAGEMIRAVFRAYERFAYDAWIRISQHIVLLGFIIYGVTQDSLYQITWGYFYSALFALLVSCYFIWKKFTTFTVSWHWPLLKNLLREAWPLALANVFVIVYFRIDTIMLSLIKGDEPTAWYNAAFLLIFSLTFVAYVIVMSVFPRLSRLAKESLAEAKVLYRQTLLLITLAGVGILGIAVFISRYLIPVVYGEAFLPAVKIFAILAVAVFFSYLSQVWLYTLNALGRQRLYTWATALGMVLNITLNWYLIPIYSYLGAAWATVITELITGGIIYAACETVFKKQTARPEKAAPPPGHAL